MMVIKTKVTLTVMVMMMTISLTVMAMMMTVTMTVMGMKMIVIKKATMKTAPTLCQWDAGSPQG